MMMVELDDDDIQVVVAKYIMDVDNDIQIMTIQIKRMVVVKEVVELMWACPRYISIYTY
ncbi:hypothetical protein BDC45DRAFT_518526 [Circinella umbellata]|nr:hypothetical protein BDC45DRAFT_518526 [Circinella umbellata]